MTVVIYVKPQRFPFYDYSNVITLRCKCIKMHSLKKTLLPQQHARAKFRGSSRYRKTYSRHRQLTAKLRSLNFREIYAGDRWPGGPATLRTSLNLKAKTAKSTPRIESRSTRCIHRGSKRKFSTDTSANDEMSTTFLLPMTYLEEL